MKELRQQTLKGILEQHPSKVVVIRAALEKMIDERIAEHVKQALSSADIEELSELLECIPVPVAEEALPVPVEPELEVRHFTDSGPLVTPMTQEIPIPEPSGIQFITEPKVTGKELHIPTQKKKDKHKNKKVADLLD